MGKLNPFSLLSLLYLCLLICLAPCSLRFLSFGITSALLLLPTPQHLLQTIKISVQQIDKPDCSVFTATAQ